MSDAYHVPVLLNAVIDGLQIQQGGIYVDATFGGGGHSKAILKHLKTGRLVAFDQDQDAIANAPDDESLTMVKANFRHLRNHLRMLKAMPVDGIMADLGVSSHQFNDPDRGFSLRFEGELDMRMSQSGKFSAHQVVNEYEEVELRRIFREYGEMRNAHKLAAKIVAARSEQKINTTLQLRELLDPFAPPRKPHQFHARVFQALRIEVNQELEALKAFLEQAIEVLKPGGRLVVISYHSLEDRLVKNIMKTGNFEGEVEKDFYGNLLRPLDPIQSKPIVPDEKEIEENNRARSARLRIAEKRR